MVLPSTNLSRNGIQAMHWNWCFSFWMEKGQNCSLCNKGDKQTLENYRPVSLLPIFWKILEILMFSEMFNFFFKVNLFHRISAVLNWGILAWISCCLSLMRNMNHLMWDANVGRKVRSVFLDMSKAFDKVWHDVISTN